MRWLAAAQPKIVLCERERERDSGTRHLVIQTSLKLTVLPSCPHTSFQELFSYYILFSLTLSLSKTFRGCVMSPLFFSSYLSRGTTLSLSFLSMLSSICYKVMSPLFRHGPMQTPPLKLHYRPAGHGQKVFEATGWRRFSPERAHISVLHHVELEAFNSIARSRWMPPAPYRSSLGAIQTHDKNQRKTRTKWTLAFLKIFHGLPSYSSAFTLVFVSVHILQARESADLNGRCCVYNKYTKSSILYCWLSHKSWMFSFVPNKEIWRE